MQEAVPVGQAPDLMRGTAQHNPHTIMSPGGTKVESTHPTRHNVQAANWLEQENGADGGQADLEEGAGVEQEHLL